jgi:predicted component of type VI protein secretion system
VDAGLLNRRGWSSARNRHSAGRSADDVGSARPNVGKAERTGLAISCQPPTDWYPARAATVQHEVSYQQQQQRLKLQRLASASATRRLTTRRLFGTMTNVEMHVSSSLSSNSLRSRARFQLSEVRISDGFTVNLQGQSACNRLCSVLLEYVCESDRPAVCKAAP